MTRTTFRPGLCKKFTSFNFNEAVKSLLKQWPQKRELSRYKPAYIYIHPADFVDVANAVSDTALALPIRVDDTGELGRGKVRICTDKEVEF